MSDDQEMPVPVEEPGEEAASPPSAEEERARLFAEAEARAAKERRKALDRIISAMDLLDHADPLLLGEARARRAVRGSRLVEQRASKPSLGGQTPENMERIAREEASREMAWQAEQRARSAWVDNQADAIRNLTAGQSPENVARIKAEFAAQRGR